MVKAGLHLGHKPNKWNPKMKPFIYGQRDNFHVIDLIKTSGYLTTALQFLTHSTSHGKTVLFVGTKNKIGDYISQAAIRCHSFYVTEKWVGGMLTNWKTMSLSTQRLRLLDTQEKSGFFENRPQKERAKILKEKEKLEKYLSGIKDMRNLPDIVIIIGQKEEIYALKECKKLGIRSITLLDTDCDPSLSDFIIPANDDTLAGLQLLLDEFIKAIKKGQAIFSQKQQKLKQQKSNQQKVEKPGRKLGKNRSLRR
jgi:small subunit ribosomal protein S2